MDDLYLLRSGLAMLIIAGGHVGYRRIEQALREKQALWLSLTGGIAIGYVFLNLLPKLGQFTTKIIEAEPMAPEFWHYRLYLLGLTGLVLYFFIDRYGTDSARKPASGIVLHAVGFCAYNALIGYLLAHIQAVRAGFVPHLPIALVLGLHLFAIDHQLRQWHADIFDRTLRWLLAASVVAGWLAGVLTPVSESALAAWSAFLSGGILINVLNQELPRGRTAHVPAFLAGIGMVVLVVITVRTLSRAVATVQ